MRDQQNNDTYRFHVMHYGKFSIIILSAITSAATVTAACQCTSPKQL